MLCQLAYIDVFKGLIDNREEIISLIEKRLTVKYKGLLIKVKVRRKVKLNAVQEYMVLNGKVVIDQNEHSEKFDKLMEIYQMMEDEYTRIRHKKTELIDRDLCWKMSVFCKDLMEVYFVELLKK